MSYIKEIKKTIYTLPGQQGYILLNKFTDSGEYDSETDLEKIHYNLHYINSKEEYLRKAALQLTSVVTGYIRKGNSPQPGESEWYSRESYMEELSSMFDNPVPVDLLLKDFTVKYEIFKKDDVVNLGDNIQKYRMREARLTDPKEKVIYQDYKYYRAYINDINTLWQLIKGYKHIESDKYRHRVQINRIPVYQLTHEYDDRKAPRPYVKINYNTRTLGDILAYFDFTCEEFVEDIGLSCIEYAKVLERFYGAFILEDVQALDPYEIKIIDVFWNREKHCGFDKYNKLMGNKFYHREGLKTYCKDLMEREKSRYASRPKAKEK